MTQRRMAARVLITGSADGLGRATAETLLGDGHAVIVHARSVDRLAALSALIDRGAIPVNVVAPYLLTAIINRPQRLVYLSSDVHHGRRPDLAGLDWSGRRPTSSYSDSKLLVTTLAMAVSRVWPDVSSNAVDPGWVPTKMGERRRAR